MSDFSNADDMLLVAHTPGHFYEVYRWKGHSMHQRQKYKNACANCEDLKLPGGLGV